MFKDRKEQRKVLETMDKVLLFIQDIANDEIKENIKIALKILHDTKIEKR